MKIMRVRHIVTLLFLAVAGATTACAQDVEDMWSAYGRSVGGFSPHISNCSSTEVFVAIASSTLGYCIEKDYRTAALWENAKDDCATDGKRLPEPAEFKFACNNPPSGLVDMTAAPQWVSNHTVILHDYDGGSNTEQIVVPVIGNGSCSNGNWGRVAQSANTVDTAHYRCVR